ncbi:MAG: PaaI family thioesterase [Acidobacteria bacterium]|nr:PaaI family thioesterase [Acidobacteriota bacterium]
MAGMTGRPFLEMTSKMISGEIPPPPVASLIGFGMESVGDGKAVAVLDASERHANPMGTLHGGILCDLADAAMGMAWASELEEGESFTTLEVREEE